MARSPGGWGCWKETPRSGREQNRVSPDRPTARPSALGIFPGRGRISTRGLVTVNLPISFPSEAAQLREQLRAFAGATAEERLRAVADTLSAVDALSAAGGRRQEQLKYHESCERQGRDRMKEFIARHVGSGTRASE